ncbi:TPA: S49 family peptidase [Escherichia coli]|nr:S49 family peptidase [Escherichia coli]
MELLSEYGLFLAKIVTVVLAIAAIAAIIVNVAQRNKRQRGELRVNNLSEQYKEMKEDIVGSIGVVAQMPNFNRFLKSKDIDIELHTAGQYKRTLTLLGENTEEGREKFREELNETHQLFKDFVKRMRSSLDIEQVATGEHWYGQQAVEKGLVDEINTSDEVILSLMEGREVVNVRYMQRKRLIDRFTGSAAESADRLLLRWWQRGQKPLM